MYGCRMVAVNATHAVCVEQDYMWLAFLIAVLPLFCLCMWCNVIESQPFIQEIPRTRVRYVTVL